MTDTTCATDPDLFFDPARVAEAVAVCAGCPLAVKCRDGARRERTPYGVFGGEHAAARAGYLIRTETDDATLAGLWWLLPELARDSSTKPMNARRVAELAGLDPVEVADRTYFAKPRIRQQQAADRLAAGRATFKAAAERDAAYIRGLNAQGLTRAQIVERSGFSYTKVRAAIGNAYVRPPAETAARWDEARRILDSEPGITGAALGRRLGVSREYGRRLLNKWLAARQDAGAGTGGSVAV